MLQTVGRCSSNHMTIDINGNHPYSVVIVNSSPTKMIFGLHKTSIIVHEYVIGMQRGVWTTVFRRVRSHIDPIVWLSKIDFFNHWSNFVILLYQNNSMLTWQLFALHSLHISLLSCVVKDSSLNPISKANSVAWSPASICNHFQKKVTFF